MAVFPAPHASAVLPSSSDQLGPAADPNSPPVAPIIDGKLSAIGRGEVVKTEIHPALAREEAVLNIDHFS
jgi:hypothetical protein